MTKKEELIKYVIDNDFITKPNLQDKFKNLVEDAINEALSQHDVVKNEVLVFCDNCKDYMTACEDCLQKYYKWKAVLMA